MSGRSAVGVKPGQPQAVASLIDYYLKCLEAERRDSTSVSGEEIGRLVHPVPGDPAATWSDLLACPAARTVADTVVAAAAGISPVALLYSPAVVAKGASRFEPLAGVFCCVAQGELRHDPSDLALSERLTKEVSEADWVGMETSLQRAATESPAALSNALLGIIRERGLGTPVPVTGPAALGGLRVGEVALMPAFWLVETRPRYDQGLVNELGELRRLVAGSSNWLATGLGFLVQPPRPVAVTLEATLAALSNPAALTLSQADALAGCAGPLTIVTGPPGTGKTRLISALAVECILKGQSILVASKINQAVDSAVSLALRMMGRGAMVRAGASTMRQELAQEISWLAGQSMWPSGGEIVAERRQPQAAATGRRPNAGQADLDLTPISLELATLHRLSGRLRGCHPPPYRWYQWLLKRRHAAFSRSWEALHGAGDQVLDQMTAVRAVSSLALRARLDGLIAKAKPALGRLQGALQGSTIQRHKAFADLAALGFPMAVTNLSVSSNLPLSAGLFDVVVIDEATTCDPASLLPLLYRAKRVVVVGDPQQLPHITTRAARGVMPQPKLADGDGRGFSAAFDVSAYDLCAELAGPAASHTLQDHFRCPPAIISFSNESFYGGQLRIHTVESDTPCRLVEVSGDHERTQTGSLINPSQQDACLGILRDLAARVPANETLGLVAPYKAASDRVGQAVDGDAALSLLAAAHRLLVGTAHVFQGSEVDHLVFMTAAGANANDRVAEWVEDRRLFNVAVTRARKSLVIVADSELMARCGLRLTERLLRSTAVSLRTGQATADQQRLGDRLARAGIGHHAGASYRGYPLDLLDLADRPQWAVRFTPWESILGLTAVEVLRRCVDDRALAAHGVRVLNLTPLHPEDRLDEFAAERELEQAIGSG